MTQEEKRIKIAEACGITHGVKCAHTDYFNNLNAMNDAEHRMDNKLGFLLWFQEMGGTASFCSFGGNEHLWRVAHSTAAERAEAFGKTLNLW